MGNNIIVVVVVVIVIVVVDVVALHWKPMTDDSEKRVTMLL